MTQLDALAEFILQRKHQFLADVARKAKRLRLKDIIEEVETRGERREPDFIDCHSFKQGAKIIFGIIGKPEYQIIVYPENLAMYFGNLELKEYKKGVGKLYERLVKDVVKYAEEHPLPF